MGVTGLWTVVKPCARPIKLETLNRKRLAVDASIWIYQFLKAVRDKEGNALRNSHIVGFFRRICKLLYFGIKPVFVFDGGAPTLKRQTINSRKRRREGRREDAARTAGKLLAVQMQRRAEEEKISRNQKQHEKRDNDDEEPLPEDLVYVEELQMTAKERQQNRNFRKQDAYHLPQLDVSLEEMGAPNDPRIMSHEELEEYARQFHSGEDINFYDFSKIDFDGPFFLSLPAGDRYNILNAARIRSRLRMGFSKEQLDTMFPDRMAFSKFQIERVKERNDLTQRLMNINGMNDPDSLYAVGSSRIAGERGREYVLVKDNGVEGGWALGVLGNKDEGQRNKPIDVDEYGRQALSDDNDEWEDDEGGFEDVPIEGLNRLPKLPIFTPGVFDDALNDHTGEIADRRKVLYETRKQAAIGADTQAENNDDNALFVADESAQNAAALNDLFEEAPDVDAAEAENLRRAIQMSLEIPDDDIFEPDGMAWASTKDPSALTASKQTEKPKPTAGGDGLSDDEDMDFFAAMAKSKVAKSSSKPSSYLFSGPLPFEPLRTTRGTPTQKPTPAKEDDTAGGFVQPETKSREHSQLLPPWFVGGSQKAPFIAQELEDQFSGADSSRDRVPENVLNNRKPIEVISLDDDVPKTKKVFPNEIIEVKDHSPEPPAVGVISRPFPTSSAAITHPEALGVTRASPKKPSIPSQKPESPFRDAEIPSAIGEAHDDELYEWEATDEEDNIPRNGKLEMLDNIPKESPSRDHQPSPSPEFEDVEIPRPSEISQLAVTMPGLDDVPNIQQPVEMETHEYQDEGDYSDPEDAELMHQLAAEVEEHARFASTLNFKSQAENALDYEQELKQLRAQQAKDRRDADEVSQVMVTECQELLRLFGLPYITAPMEAEAQCAELVSLGLVDGIVTDDSDVFLFGGNRIYKNMFNQAKFVECYLTNDLEKEYALDRKKLVRFAHLLGSDYTEGIPGVGPVTALEILTEFSTLEEFRDWWTQVQTTRAKIPDDPHSAFRKKFKKNLTKLFLPPGFPDNRVDAAYLEPEIDPDPSTFQWGVPDLNSLRHFLMSTIGWSQERTDEVLVPVIRDMNRREQEGTQANITSFFSGSQGAGAFAPRRRADGKTRMEKAFSRLRHQAEEQHRTTVATDSAIIGEDEDVGDTEQQSSTGRRPRKRAKGRDVDKEDNEATGEGRRKARKKQKNTSSSTA
ncbi:hypothetical protein AJ80_06174 [Polytolypa hystricis UAMH7299]|uniref:DNA excision repair protein ERCC-5 n=1 Tax=Polytolypa hystricis (strain UAMH7299) TaxID=1447883 RepID=A0A2B7XY84_POLH7|nr:hypothetical protein AJ80_06174 [Polytolypa hystricis UAMH7299]